MFAAAWWLGLAWALGGCTAADDADEQAVWFENDVEAVVIRLEGADIRLEVFLSGASTLHHTLDECHRTAIVVETEDGEPVGRVDEPACPGWKLTVDEDGTLDYREL